jgi:hypothetical protein
MTQNLYNFIKQTFYTVYNKPSLIWSNYGGGEVIRISGAKGSPKRPKNLEHK